VVVAVADMLLSLAEVQVVQVVAAEAGVITIQYTHQLTDSINRQQATMLALVLIIPEVEVELQDTMVTTRTESVVAVVPAWLLLDTNRKKNERNN
jgi:hypothetical protein